MKNIRLGEVLVEYGYISEAQVAQALALQKDNKGKRLGEVLIEMGAITEAQLLSALGQKLDLEILPLATYPVQQEAVAKVPKALAVRYNLIPAAVQGGHLLVVMNDPLNFYAIEDVKLVANLPVDVALAPKAAILHAIEYHYAEVEAKNAAAQANVDADAMEMQDFARDIDLDENDQTPVVKLLNSLLVRGYNTGASDIHIEPYEEKLLVRMRIDGQLVDYVTLQLQLHQPLIARTKILAGMDIAEKRLPQDGHFKTTIENFEMNVRASVIPTIHGEKGVLRFLNTSTAIDRADTFGMDEENYKKSLAILQNPHGVVYITGPTGSGKTTTLYLMMERLVKGPVNIVTIEDPVEKNINRVNQMQVNNLAGLTFETGLRAILREDPDVILVGEMRDFETISAALTAAETGHLVFSTLHTIGAANTVDRIINACPGEIQQEVRTQLSGVLKGCITQELLPLADGSGRTAALEILVATDAALNLIREAKAYQLPSLMQTGAKDGMQTLNLHLARLVQAGRVDYAAALERASDPDEFHGYLNL